MPWARDVLRRMAMLWDRALLAGSSLVIISKALTCDLVKTGLEQKNTCLLDDRGDFRS